MLLAAHGCGLWAAAPFLLAPGSNFVKKLNTLLASIIRCSHLPSSHFWPPPGRHVVCLLRSATSHYGLSISLLSARPFLFCPQKKRLFCSVNASDIYKGLRSHCPQSVPAPVLLLPHSSAAPGDFSTVSQGCSAWTSWEVRTLWQLPLTWYLLCWST